MYFIYVDTLEIKRFNDHRQLNYCILSHRWTNEELSFANYSNPAKRRGLSFKKIVNFCRLLRSPNSPRTAYGRIDWVWVDNCCIDRRSSAELTEAINSMHKWYNYAQFCVAYLADVTGHDRKANLASTVESEWFRRGWTLQELLAPKQVHFYNAKWQLIGSRNGDQDMTRVVSQASGINVDELTSFCQGRSKASVAQRLSWAARRSTTIEEDIAYCLLGIFDVNMPLLYGEGPNAFRRLQTLIYQKTGDESIFVSEQSGQALATDPHFYWGCGNVVPTDVVTRRPIIITERALKYTGPATEIFLQSRLFVVKLNAIKYCRACASPSSICATHPHNNSGKVSATSCSLLFEQLPGPRIGVCRVVGCIAGQSIVTSFRDDIKQPLLHGHRRNHTSIRLQAILTDPHHLIGPGLDNTQNNPPRYSLDQHDGGPFFTANVHKQWHEQRKITTLLHNPPSSHGGGGATAARNGLFGKKSAKDSPAFSAPPPSRRQSLLRNLFQRKSRAHNTQQQQQQHTPPQQQNINQPHARHGISTVSHQTTIGF